MSYNYVQAHDAERTNFISWMTVLKQKISSFFHSIVWDSNASDAERQQEMIRNYKELVSYLEKSACTISIPTADINERITTLSTITAAEFKTQALSYSSFASQVYTEMQEKCKK